MVEVRRVQKEDWDDIVELSTQHGFSLPDFQNFLSSVVIVKDGKVIAFAYVKALVEAVFLPDRSSKKNIVSSLRLVYDKLLEDVKEMDVKQIHVFTDNLEYADILKSHFHFDDIVGKGIVLEVANG